MKKLLFITLITSFAFACSSDCLICHPKLKPMEYNKTNKQYKNHHILITCTKCHPNHSDKGMDKCGADCFECHSQKKLIKTPIKEHQQLKKCIKCHKQNESIKEIIPENKDFLNIKKFN